MIHIKYFKESNEYLPVRIDNEQYQKGINVGNKEMFEEHELNKICNKIYEVYGELVGDKKDKGNWQFEIYESYLTLNCKYYINPGNVLNKISLFITKCKDEWYYVSLTRVFNLPNNSCYESVPYKIDQLDELLIFIEKSEDLIK